MGARRKAREAALQFLFQDDFGLGNDHASEDLPERFGMFCTLYQINRKARPYTFELLQGILRRRDKIDELIQQAATNWRLQRIAGTDRNLLRLAVFEMLEDNDIADQVAINEAVEIAKRYGSDDSPSFVNGVLDAVKSILRG